MHRQSVWIEETVNDTSTDGLGSVFLPSQDSFLSQTHTCKICGRQILVLHRRCNWHPESDTYCYDTYFFLFFFFVFFVQRYQRGARQKWFTPRERKKLVKIKEIQLSVPCCDPPQMERKTDTRYKNITIFIYQTACGGFVQKSEEDFTFCFFFFFWLLPAVPIVRRTPTRFASTSAFSFSHYKTTLLFTYFQV